MNNMFLLLYIGVMLFFLAIAQYARSINYDLGIWGIIMVWYNILVIVGVMAGFDLKVFFEWLQWKQSQ